MERPSAQLLDALARIMQLMRLLYHNRPMMASELAATLGISEASVYRYLEAIEGPPLYVPIVRSRYGFSIHRDWKF